ncbi:hypothetical protein JK361_24270 [Streptomyces sp. 5-8]|uniref:Nuclear transport factor 2 family protein n=1 Tax=Streptomyces musisoli TaxID=2802280 RepID=A0ABS1P682_9ACTN|nr:hypothetical protein [Streptomyces musisoli]MBL1107679.1 hypothetical protein [Streptomyces musisoli]
MSWNKWTRGPVAALAVCVLLPFAAVACTTGEAHGGTVSPSPVGKVLDNTDETGRNLREVPGENAPEVAVEVIPDSADGWDVRLSFRHFRCSAPGTRPAAAIGRGLAHLFVDGRRVARLHGPAYHLAAGRVPQGTHQITARLYADDGTVWAVRGKPVETTVDITVSDAEADATRQPAKTASSGAGG